jgi:DNA-binding Lrp family transcriptional regulator
MITITKKENIILNQIKYFQSEYRDGVPYNILKLDLDISETKFRDILDNLENKGLISKSDDYIQTEAVDSKINVVDSRAEVLKEDLNQTEKKAFELIKSKSNNGLISRYALEGNLLYGDLKLGNIAMYHLIIELENKGLIKKIQMKDGEYYSL